MTVPDHMFEPFKKACTDRGIHTWECDLIMFRKEHGKANVTSLVERVSRFTVVMRNEDRQSKPIMKSLIEGLAPLPADAHQSITFDRGTEFSAWQRLKDGIGANAWFL